MKLIKFSAYNSYLLEGLINQTLFFCNVFKFNDPFEGIFRYKAFSDRERFEEFYLNEYGGRQDKLNYYFNNIIEFEEQLNRSFAWRYENNGVCCFSEGSNLINILMWANYANNHKGVCLVFDKSQLAFESQIIDSTYIDKPRGPHIINYTNEYLDSNPLTRELNQDSFLTTKFDIWVQENEFRFISPRPGNFVFERNSLIEVVFGLRSSSESKETIKKIVKEKYNNVRFQQIELSKDKFGLNLKEIE